METKNSCGYFPEIEDQQELFLLPTPQQAMELYGATEDNDPDFVQQIYYADLLEQGFRRSHNMVYRNTCPHCKKCLPLRIRAKDFVPSKSQRYSLKKNSDITCVLTDSPEKMISQEKILMYREYMKKRNNSSLSMEEAAHHLMTWNGIVSKEEPSLEEGQDRLEDKEQGNWPNKGLELFYKGTRNLDYYLGDRLLGCSILDMAADRISSAYFYYDVSEDALKRGLGTFSILNEIYICAKLEVEYYDLGYWIKDCRKMSYKSNFKPYEILVDGQWIAREGT